MRLGEALIESGHLTQAQLESALNAQLIFGGHLGTCLIELGYVDEQTLGNLLAQVYNVRYAHPGLLDDIPPQVLSALNQGTVEKHMVVPFDLVKKTLHVAMVNPAHVPSLDELCFVSGLRIDACVSPEVRIFQAMERYYQVPRRVRYIALARNLDERKKKAPAKRKAVAVATQSVAAQSVATAAGGVVPLPPLVTLSRSADSNDDARPETQAPGPHATAKPAAGSNGFEERLNRTAEELCRAESTGIAIRALLDHAAGDASRCILFGMKNTEAFIRDVRGFVLDAVSAHKVRFDVTTEPLLTLLAGESFYRGPVPGELQHRGFFEALRTAPPREILLLPVHQHDRLAALLYADGGTESRIDGDTESLVRAVRKFTLTLDLIDMKHRIRSA